MSKKNESKTPNKIKDESVIPTGFYCYDANGVCPYWSIRQDKPYRRNGYCSFLERGDWEKIDQRFSEDHPIQTAQSLLWDKCKECGKFVRKKKE
jgi:hypothetical protein